jgi:hypothetical protein
MVRCASRDPAGISSFVLAVVGTKLPQLQNYCLFNGLDAGFGTLACEEYN